ncbi:MAG TPA: glycosyl hydrolase family 28-related protein, partial [Anaerohalosphaeraceae bacterium]|nr:glycosyl hydrolase family 28-related protein [Anaerohalosphaeraceae bacterium]
MNRLFQMLAWTVAAGIFASSVSANTDSAGTARADSRMSEIPIQKGKAAWNVCDFGAAGDGKALDSPAIDKAIEACAQAGGGTVYLPAGTYLSGSIHLKSNVNLHLGAGAVILGAPQEMNAYDFTEPWEGTAYQDGGHTYFHNSLIWGENLTNVS